VPKGKIISTVTIDVINIAEMADYMFNVVYNFCLIICMIVVFMKINFTLASIVLLVVITYIIIANKLTKKSANYMRGQRGYQDKLTNLLGQMLNGIREITTFNMILKLNIKYDSIRRNWAKKYMLKRKYVIGYNVKLKYIIYITKIILYILCARLLFNDKITIGVTILLITYFDNIFSYTTKMISDMGKVRNYNISLDRVYDLLENQKISDLYGKVNNNYINGKVEFKNVSFAYKKIPTIKNISFTAIPNKISVIAGKTGSGKTTIFSILLRLYKPDKGEVYIDDININEYSKEVYYSNVSVVNQESFLFNMSITDNLSMVNKDKCLQIKVCKRIGIHDFIKRLPRGYDTILSDNGGNLSGGQKRLLSLAKTLLTGSEILLFDEATSSLDPKTTNNIIRVIKDLKKDHTIIIITHKEKIMKIADELILINNGKIVKKGTYDELINDVYLRRLVGKDTK